MKRLLAVTIIFALTACGGGPAARPDNTYGTDYFKNTLTKEGAYFITRDEFPDLYDAIIKKDSSAMFRLLGHPSSLSYGTTSTSHSIYIQTGKPASEVYTRTRNSLLYYTMKHGDLDKASELISEGADPNNKNRQANTPLHLALSADEEMPDRLALIRMLIEAGADLNATGYRDDTPLMLSIKKQNMTPETPRIVRTLLDAGAAPDIRNRQGDAPLLTVLGRDNQTPDTLELVRMLLSAGADPDIKNNHGATPLHTALQQDNPSPDALALVRVLLEAGANPNTKNHSGQTALHALMASAMTDKTEALGALMDHGADPSIKDASGQTALHAALRTLANGGDTPDEDEAIAWLGLIITPGTDLDARNKRGKTPLAYAFFGNRKKVEEYLLSKGATDYGIKNNSYDLPDEGNISTLGLSSSEVINLNKDQCSFILKEYDVEFEHLPATKGVQIPIKLNSPIGGIKYSHTHGSKKFSIMDCRLAVTLVGWAPVLREHHVKEVVHMRTYSPGARVGGGAKVSGHNYAMAIDAAHFIMDDGTRFEMNTGWTDRRHRADPCQPPKAGDAGTQKVLRKLACDTGSIDLFNIILTPHYNKAHYDHLHMELASDQYMFIR